MTLSYPSRSNRMTILMLSVAAMTFPAVILPAKAQTTATPNVQAAYELAMKCFVANVYAQGEAKDQEEAVSYKTKANIAFDKAVSLGKQLGYSNQRINGDFDAYRERELPRMFHETGYFSSVAATCRAYGMM